MKKSVREEKERTADSAVRQMENEAEAYEIWKKYEQGKDYHYKIDLQDRTDMFFRFYHGDQWHGINAGNEDLPTENVIKGVVKYKVSTVCQNQMQAYYNPIETNEQNNEICDRLNRFFTKQWEAGKLDSLCWDVVFDSAITGAGYVFFGDGADTGAGQIIDNINIFFADEKDSNIQEQKYIIIRERRFVADVKEEAIANGISEEDAEMVTADTDYQEQLGEKQEQDYSPKDGKCISLLYMYKDKEGYVHVAKTVKNLVYMPDTVLRQVSPDGELLGGLTMYPVVNMIWEPKKNDARGYGEVEFMIPNQLVINKTLARRAIAIKNTAFPKLAYNKDAVQNPDALTKAGAKIGFADFNGSGLGNIIGYLSPSYTAPDAKNLTDELTQQTRDLAGAGDAATGAIDPTKASGAAIIAVRDQSSLPLNEQMAKYCQFVEDIAYLWFDMWKAYNPNGLEVTYDKKEADGGNNEEIKEIISAEALKDLTVNVRVDVSKKSAYDRYAQEQSLEHLFEMQAISFDEYVEALDDDAVMPKGKLELIIQKRQQAQMMQAQTESQMQALSQENAELKQLLEQITGIPNPENGQGQAEGAMMQGVPMEGQMPMQGVPAEGMPM